MLIGEQFFIMGEIDPEIARILHRRAGNSQMHFRRPRITEFFAKSRRCCSADKGIVHKADPFSTHDFFHDIVLHAHGGSPRALSRSDKAASYVVVADKSAVKRYAEFFRKTHGG